jgi:L-lactate permease
MTDIFALQVILVALAAGLAVLIITAGLPGWKKVVALVLFSGLIATGYYSVAELLGRPKPAHLASIVSGNQTVTIVASYLRENEAIYLWLMSDDASTPIAFVLPWSLEAAKKLRKAKRKARTSGTALKMARRKGNALARGEWVFHAAPVEKLPSKSTQG